MTILLAVDNTEFSEAATRALISRHRRQDVEVKVLHVVEAIAYVGMPQAPTAYVPKWEDQVEQARQLVNRVAQTLRAAGFTADTVVAEGDVRTEIIDAAQKGGADLIVLGSHGRTGLARFSLGSVSDAVMRHAHCSVEIVRVHSKQ